jgi:hypothetical protein
MTFTVLLIALAHGIPIFLAGAYWNTKLSVTLVALAMCVVAVATGASQFAIFDLVAIGVVYFLCIRVVGDSAHVSGKPPPTQPEQTPRNQKPEESSGWGIVVLIVIGFLIYNKVTETPTPAPLAVVHPPKQTSGTPPPQQASVVPAVQQSDAISPSQQPNRRARRAHSQDTTAADNATIQDLRDNCKPPKYRIVN